jgi:hypothetical protein
VAEWCHDEKGQTLILNEELAAHAIGRALADRGLRPEAVRIGDGNTTRAGWQGSSSSPPAGDERVLPTA